MPLLHILLCSSLDTPPEPSPLFDVRVHASRRRTSPLVLTHPSLSARSRARFRHPLSFHALTPSRARAQCHCQRPRRPSSPPCLDSLRPEPHNLALCLLHPFPSSFEPTPGRIDLQSACDRRPPLPRHAGAPPLRRSPSSGLPPPDSSRGELGRDLLHLPDPFPGRIPSPRRRSAAAPPCPRRPHRAHAAGRSARAPLAAAARPTAAWPPWSLRRPLPPPPCPTAAGTAAAVAPPAPAAALPCAPPPPAPPPPAPPRALRAGPCVRARPLGASRPAWNHRCIILITQCPY